MGSSVYSVEPKERIREVSSQTEMRIKRTIAANTGRTKYYRTVGKFQTL